jgi:hypothetical protein
VFGNDQERLVRREGDTSEIQRMIIARELLKMYE